MSKRKNFEAPESSSIANFNRMIGAEDNTPVYPGQDVISIDENLTKLIDEQRWATVRDQMGVHSKGLMGVEETKQGIDIYQEVDTDKDGNIHTYDVMVTPDGKTKRLGLADTMQNVNIVDVLNKKEVNPAYTQYIKEKLFGKMFTDTDPETGKMYSDTSKGFFENAIMNMATSQLSILGAKIFGESSIGKHGVWDPVLNKLDFNENGKVTYDGIDLSLSSKELSPVMDWFQRKTTFKSSGFMESFANTGLTFLGDMPLFYLSGSGAGAILGKALPSIMNASSIPAKFAQHLMQNYLMLNMVETPRMITHGLYEGSDALLEDIKHTAEFAVMAGGFSTIGDLAGLGVSHLMQRAKPLTTSNISSFLKQNPRIQENLIGGFASGLLGYTTAEGSTQDKLATGLVFASMHFSSPKGWKNYIKGEGKTVMLDKVNFESLQKLRRSGVSLEEAYRELGITEPKYYEREKSNLYEIDGDAFTNKGEVNRLGSEPIVLDRKNIGNFNYIAEAEPFAKVTLRQAFQDTKIANLHEKVLAEGFKNIENPFDKTSEKDKWENFEFNKSLTAGKLAVILYGENLYKQIKQNGLPEDINLSNIITKSAEGLNMPRKLYEKFIIDNFPGYARDPKAWKELKWLPEEYRKSFESALSLTEQTFKRQANQRMIELLNDRAEKMDKAGVGGLRGTTTLLGIESIYQAKNQKTGELETKQLEYSDISLVSEAQYNKALDMIKDAKHIDSIYDAIEKAGYSEKVFDDLRGKIKAEQTSKLDVEKLAGKTGEEKLNKDLDTEAGLAMIEKEFGSRKLAESLTPEEISNIGKTGAIEPKTREALQQLSEESWKGSTMPDELLPTKENPTVEIPPKVADELQLGYEVKEPRKAYVSDSKGGRELVDVLEPVGKSGNAFIIKDTQGKLWNTFSDKLEFLTQPVVDHKTFITEIKDIRQSKIARQQKDMMDMEFNTINDGEYQGRKFLNSFAEALWGVKDANKTGFFKEKPEENGYLYTSESEKRSISEAVKSIRKAIEETLGDESLTQWDAYSHIWKLAEKMPEVGFHIFYGKHGKGKVENGVREYSNTGGNYDGRQDAIGLNMEHASASLFEIRETLAHEVLHALMHGRYKGKDGKVHEYSVELEPHLKKIWDVAEREWNSVKDTIPENTLKHWGRYVFNEDGKTVNPVQEMVTVGFTSPDFARWLNGIAMDGIRSEKKGSTLQALRDTMMEWFGITRLFEKSALDSITEVFNNKFAEWGVFDQKTGMMKDNVRVGENDTFYNELSSKNNVLNTPKEELKTPANLSPQANRGGSDKLNIEGDTNILPKKEKTVKSELERNFDRNVEGWKPKHFIDTDKLAIEAIFKGASIDKNFSPSIIINQESEGSRPLTREALLNIIASNAKHTLGNISHHNPAYTSKKMSEMLSFIKLLPEIDASYRGTVERISGRFEEEVNRNLLLGNKYEELNALKNQKMREYKELFGRDYLEEKSLALKEDRLEEFKAQNPELESLTSEINGLRNEFNGRMEVGNRTALIEKTIRELQNNAGEEIVRSPKFEEVSRKPITLDVEAEKPLPKSEPEAKTRKVEKEEIIKPRAEIIRDREFQEKESLRTGAIQNKDRREPIVSFGEKAQDFMIRHTSINDIGNKVRDYLYQSIVPVFRKETSPRFREDAYKYGEELMRQAPYQFNTIMKRHDGWAGGQAWRKFGDVNPVNGEVRSQNGKDFLNAFKDYEYGRYQGKISKDLTWDEFKTWANMNPEQQKMLDIYRASVKAGIDKMKEMKVKYMVELDPNLANYITKSPKSLKEYGMEGLAKEEIEQRVASNLELKRKIAQKAIDDHYANWDKHVYYNSIRPVNKNSILVEVTRDSMNRKDKEGNFISDREYSYFDSMKEAQDYLNSKVAEGWTKQEMLRVKDILTKQDHWGKLNVSQLMQLANDGHIPLTNDIIQKLMDITKKGVDLHDISKEYIPGMKYTGQEFELQFERFLREAIYGSHKSYSLTKINDNLNKWRADIDSIIGGISKTSTKGIDAQTIQKLEEEYKYAYGYYNQLRAPEKSIIDPIRGFTFSYYIGGLKPGFLFQQSLQTLQTSLHQGYRELSAGKLGTFGDATRLLGEASAEAIKAGIALRALKEGKDISRIGADAEYVKVLQDLELMGKMRNVGIAEMTGMSGESDYFYSHNFNKVSEGFIRISNALGGGIEKFTRVQTAGLFYKIGKQKGLSGEGLLNFVADGIDKSMAEFGKGGRAPVFDSKGSIPNQGTITNAMKKSFLTLKTFSFYNTSMYYDIIKSKQWGALGTKMMAGTGMHGITKFPLIASLFMLAELFTDEDMDYTTLRAAYELDDKLPVPLGKFLRGGFGGFAGIDTRDMLSETTPLVTDLVANSWAPTWEGKLLEVTLGAPLGFTKDAVEAADGIKDELKYRILGDTMYTKTERDRQVNNFNKAAPLWIRNIIKSMDYNEDGVTLRGNEIIAREDLSGWDIFLKAMSFPVDRINTAYIEGKDGFDAQIGHHKSVISSAKKYMLEVRDNSKLSGESKREEIKKAENSIKESKAEIINLEKQKRERDRK